MFSIVERLENGEKIEDIVASYYAELLDPKLSADELRIRSNECDKRLSKAIEQNNYAILKNGPAVLRVLLEAFKNPAQKQAMIAFGGFVIFRGASVNGDVGAMKLLLQHVDPEKKQEMIEVKGFTAFRAAAIRGHLAAVKLILQEVDPEKKQEMIASWIFMSFNAAAQDGHSGVVNQLLQDVAPWQEQAMIASLVHLQSPIDQRMTNLIHLPNFLNSESDPSYKKSEKSFIPEVARRTYIAACNALRGGNEAIPLTTENHQNFLSNEQRIIAKTLTRKMVDYIAENIENFKVVQGMKMARAADVRNRRSGKSQDLLSPSLPQEIDITIAKMILPSFNNLKPEDLGPQFALENGEKLKLDVEKANRVAKQILVAERLTVESLLEPSFEKPSPAAASPAAAALLLTDLEMSQGSCA